MEMKPGSRWASAVCDAEVVVVRPPKSGGDLACGGHAVVAHGGAKPDVARLDTAQDPAPLVGKRYVDADSGLEVLCVKAGKGALSLDGRPLALKEAKALPASD